MKTDHSILAIGVLALILTNQCLADLNGSDDFNDNSKDPTRWGTDLVRGVGSLTETNGRLEYTTTGVPTTGDLSSRPWIKNFGSYTQDWEVRIDVSMPQPALAATQLVCFGLVVFPSTNIAAANTNRFEIYYGRYGSVCRFNPLVAINKAETDLPVKVSLSTYAGVRIAFDATTKVLGAYYDEDGPACGYSWTLLTATNVSAAWNMNSTSLFGIAPVGNSMFTSVASTNNVFGDNFSTSSGVSPRLGVFRESFRSLAGGNDWPPWQLRL
jgi:hypothetical protein